MTQEAWTRLLDQHLLRRLGTAEDVAYCALYLCSDEASWDDCRFTIRTELDLRYWSGPPFAAPCARKPLPATVPTADVTTPRRPRGSAGPASRPPDDRRAVAGEQQRRGAALPAGRAGDEGAFSP
ncbi:hypothetical protein [Amycolatopsis sp. NPDC051903]|uniref:hypothetical protein n=1 Tax=Amycolatopsis sp. NPDC051903 TaxID=3363936 RepID=UPI00379152C4